MPSPRQHYAASKICAESAGQDAQKVVELVEEGASRSNAMVVLLEDIIQRMLASYEIDRRRNPST